MNYDEYIKGIHKIGTACMLGTMVMTFVPAIYIWVHFNCFPGMAVISGCIVAMLGQEAMSWFIEPTMWFPILGVTGSYMSSLSGNTSSMRLPVALACQAAVNAERGTEKAEMAATIGMASTVFLNLGVLAIVLVFGEVILAVLPDVIKGTFNYAVAGVMGAMIPMIFSVFMPKKKK